MSHEMPDTSPKTPEKGLPMTDTQREMSEQRSYILEDARKQDPNIDKKMADIGELKEVYYIDDYESGSLKATIKGFRVAIEKSSNQDGPEVKDYTGSIAGPDGIWREISSEDAKSIFYKYVGAAKAIENMNNEHDQRKVAKELGYSPHVDEILKD